MGGYWKIINKTSAVTIVLLKDTPENILTRITFYDSDSHPISRSLTDREKSFYLREIKRDIAYFSRSFQRAHISVDIAGCSSDEASHKIKDTLTLPQPREQGKSKAIVRGTSIR